MLKHNRNFNAIIVILLNIHRLVWLIAYINLMDINVEVWPYFNILTIYFNILTMYFNILTMYFNILTMYFNILTMYFNILSFVTFVVAIIGSLWAFFIDTSEYKQISLIGWLYYASDTYFQDTFNFGWLICLILMGGFNGLGINFAWIVRAEKYISTNKTFYVYLAQPIIATVIGYLFLPEQFPIPGVFTIIGGLVWLVGQYLLSM